MTSMRSKWLALVIISLTSSVASASPALACWTGQESTPLIDVDGAGRVQGAWSVPESLLPGRLQRGQEPPTLLLAGYDVLSAQRICAENQVNGASQVKILFGGRERLLARQGAPAWDWLLVSTDSLAANLLSGELQGVFVGEGKVVVGRGLTKSKQTSPSALASSLIDRQQKNFEPVVLFVSAEHQQSFFEFFSNNPLPGVFLSFDEPEKVRDVLNKYASVSADDQARELNYYCN